MQHIMTLLWSNSSNKGTVSTKHSGHDFGTSTNVGKIGAEEAVKLLGQVLGEGPVLLIQRNWKLQQPSSVVVHPVDQLGPVLDGVPSFRVLKSAQAVLDSA